MKKSSRLRNKQLPIDLYALEKVDLYALEKEVRREGEQWMKKRMEEKLREKTAAFSPGEDRCAPARPAPEADD